MIARPAALVVLLLAATPAAIAAPPTPQQLQEAERARAAQLQAQHDAAARAQAAADEAKRLADERVAAAVRLRTAESATAEAAARVADLAEQQRVAQAELDERARAFRPLLPLIERLSLYPAETLLAVPVPPEQALRGVVVLGGLAKQLEADAAALRATQAKLSALQTQMAAELPRLAAAQATQAHEEAGLDQQIAAAQATQTAAEDAAADASKRAATEASRADGLRTAIARLEADRRAAEAQARQAADLASRQRREADAADARRRQEALARPAGPGVGEAHGQLMAPVAGTIVRSYGEASDAGPATGISYQAPPSARVVSPCGGRVVFSGPFRSYGQLLIIDCGASYHFVLAGLERLDAQVGHPVQAGEPVGVMPGWDPRAGGARPSLYVELRQNGEPVNPAPFLRAKS